MRDFFKKGQISLFAAIVGATGMIGASVITSWATTSNKVWGIEQSTSVLNQREADHYIEIQKRLDSIEGKIDFLIQNKLKK